VCVLSYLGFWLVFSQGSCQLASPAGLVHGYVAASSPRPWLSTGLHAPSDGGLTRLRVGRTHFWLSTGCWLLMVSDWVYCGGVVICGMVSLIAREVILLMVEVDGAIGAEVARRAAVRDVSVEVVVAEALSKLLLSDEFEIRLGS